MSTNSTAQEVQDTWACLELLGKKKVAGRIEHASVCGGNYIRVHVPKTDFHPTFTKDVAHAAVYSISYVTQSIAQDMANEIEASPPIEYHSDLAKLPRLKAALEQEQEARVQAREELREAKRHIEKLKRALSNLGEEEPEQDDLPGW